MNFPKLQSLMEAKKKPVQDEMDFEVDMTDEAPADKPKGDKPAVDKAAVLAYLKGCDVKCRADVKKKLDKMCEADMAAEEK